MKYILRIKAVSECMGIRRANLSYTEYENKTEDFTSLGHPLKKFKSLEIAGEYIIVNGSKQKLVLGEEIYFQMNNQVNTGNGFENEQLVMGIMLMPLDKEAIPYYEEQIKNGYLFDQWNGEFEYIIGLNYEFGCNDINNAEIWYQNARAKGFRFEILRKIN